jgi:hypothetical protein
MYHFLAAIRRRSLMEMFSFFLKSRIDLALTSKKTE